jgi:hypothetical protein
MRSRIYRDLTTKKVDEVTIDELDTFRGGFYAQGRKNKSQYHDLNELALTSNQNATKGNIPGSSDAVTITNIYDNKSTLLQKTQGTFETIVFSFFEGGGSGTYTHEIYFEVNGASILVASSTDSVFQMKLEFDKNVVIQANTIGGGGTPTTAGVSLYYMRCR